jgi:L-ascorbate metabolism protein UlaG (beta-lactamase superfamily)
MQITWHGLNCARLQGKDVSVIIDPFQDKVGPKLPRWQADIVLVSSEELDESKGGKDSFTIAEPGEYEIKGTFVYGVNWKQEKGAGNTVLFRANVDGISVGHLGGLDRVVPNATLETLEGVDILLLPVGDPNLLSATEAVEVISRIEPRIIIPMSIPAKGFKQKLESPEKFYKELGKNPEVVDKLKITQKDLPEAEQLLYQIELS